MCGDGANDCGALKAAHAGISVSGEESSVASPFTSRDGHVGCVPLIIREGRAALTTSFGMFKFMVAYSLAEFLSVAFLYYFDSNLTDFQFLYVDIFLSINFAFFFGKTEAYPGKLCKIPPGMSLLGFVPLVSLILQLLIITIFQVASFMVLTTYSWYVPHQYEGDEEYACHENYAIFTLSMFQYITLAISFSQGYPYRKSIFTNYIFMLSLFIMAALGVYIVMYPADWLANLLELLLPPDYDFRFIVLGLAFANFVCSLFSEKFIVQYLMQAKKMVPKSLRENAGSTHKSIEKELENQSDWPPISINGSGDTLNIVNDKKIGNNNKLNSGKLDNTVG